MHKVLVVTISTGCTYSEGRLSQFRPFHQDGKMKTHRSTSILANANNPHNVASCPINHHIIHRAYKGFKWK